LLMPAAITQLGLVRGLGFSQRSVCLLMLACEHASTFIF